MRTEAGWGTVSRRCGARYLAMRLPSVLALRLQTDKSKNVAPSAPKHALPEKQDTAAVSAGDPEGQGVCVCVREREVY